MYNTYRFSVNPPEIPPSSSKKIAVFILNELKSLREFSDFLSIRTITITSTRIREPNPTLVNLLTTTLS